MFLNIRRGEEPGPELLIRLRDSALATDILIAAVGCLGLFDWLSENPCTLESLCATKGYDERPAAAMLTLLTSWGLLHESDGLYRVGKTARDYLCADSPRNIIPYIASLKSRSSVAEVVDILHRGHARAWKEDDDSAGKDRWGTLMQGPDFAAFYTSGMDTRGTLFGPALADTLDCQGHRRLLDIAGGSGVYTAHLLLRYPHLAATVLERPPVDALARARLRDRGLDSRAQVVAGDMFTDDYPTGHDLHLLSHVLHNWPLDKVRTILRRSFAAMPRGGEIAIFSVHLNDRPGGPPPGPMAEYSVLLAFLYEGRCYGVKEMRDELSAAGFGDFRCLATICHRTVLTARKP